MTVRDAIERAALPEALYEDWSTAVNTRDYDDKPGKMGEILAELWDWLSETDVFTVFDNSLSRAEMLAVRYEIDSSWGLESDVEGELYRVAVLGVGANRTAEQVLRDLVDADREREDYMKVVTS